MHFRAVITKIKSEWNGTHILQVAGKEENPFYHHTYYRVRQN